MLAKRVMWRLFASLAAGLVIWPLSLHAAPGVPRGRARHPLSAQTSAQHTVEFGLASWYGARFRRHLTASGVRFDDRELTAAHRSLPLGTRVKVTDLKSGRSVVVKVTDRGPWVRGRLIDVSRAAAQSLGFERRGLARVRVAVVSRPRRNAAKVEPAVVARGADHGDPGTAP
jgi:rare lipoprotein A